MSKKLKFFFSLFLFGLMGSGLFAQRLQYIPGMKIYVPLGFDSNDKVEVVVMGRIPSNCYYGPEFETTIDDLKININLKAKTRIEPGKDCKETKIDFLETVSLGKLEEGAYELVLNEGTGFQKYAGLNVEKAMSDEVDSFVYADVSYIEHDVFYDMYYLVGTNPNDCYDLDQIKIVSNKKDVYAILPIMKKVKEICEDKPQNFKYPFQLPRELDAEMVLLHVRAMNGKAVNKVVRNIH